MARKASSLHKETHYDNNNREFGFGVNGYLLTLHRAFEIQQPSIGYRNPNLDLRNESS